MNVKELKKVVRTDSGGMDESCNVVLFQGEKVRAIALVSLSLVYILLEIA